ncbi:BTAD domain-containing putative transcriptional regulator [Nonomuraea angiospora]|uniref:AfsR/SARP family transcriptional regulator n=1 Tax=Nonomuraea angiospora TaxID=46172 RepID=UPI0034409FDE
MNVDIRSNAGFRFGILGPLEVLRDGRPISLPAAKQRIVLATLLLRANRNVSPDELIERVWADAVPHNARSALYTHVARLRRALGEDPGGDGSHRLIRTSDDGYVIDLPPEALDLSRFRELVARAGAGTDAAGEADLLDRALGLWRGPVLAGVPSESLHRDEVPLVVEERLRVVDRWFQLGLRLGRDDEMVKVLKEATAEHPFHERLWAQLLVALHRSGRRAEALETYRSVVALLRDELGVDPGQELARLHSAILADEPEPALLLDDGHLPPPAEEQDPPPSPVRPQQLPSDLASFTGRRGELAALNALLDREDAHASPPIVIAAISGMGGVGKTALAVHWAHSVVDRFPDGVLHLNLRGFGPGTPVEPHAALELLLNALGVVGQRVPAETDARSALLRSVLAGRRVLMLLDNARDAAQVRPLLPGSRSFVLVTSRNQMRGLAVREGARPLVLGRFSPGESTALLAEILGPERIGAEPWAAAELARSCVHLPLALTIAAEHAMYRPDSPLHSLAEEVRAQRSRLDALDTSDDHEASVRAVLSWSYLALEPPAARMFRLLSLHPGPDVGPGAAAALAGVPVAEARRLLDVLADRSLLERPGQERHRFHDLLHAYAAEQSALADGAAERAAAVRRVLNWYLHTASRAADLVEPTRRRFPDVIDRAPAEPPALEGPEGALMWVEEERANLVAAVALSAGHGWDDFTWRLAHALWRFFLIRGHVRDWIDTHLRALDAARDTGDPRVLAETMKNLGFAYWRAGHLSEALDHHGRALVLDQESGDGWGEAKTRNHLGFIHDRAGHFAEALRQQQRSLARYREAGDLCGQGRALVGIGNAYRQLGHHSASMVHLKRALAITCEIGDRWGESLALTAIGFARLTGGYGAEATRPLYRALTISREMGDRWGESMALIVIGLGRLINGEYGDPSHPLCQALAISREIGDRWSESLALTAMGFASLASGRNAETTRYLRRALTVSHEIRCIAGADDLLHEAFRTAMPRAGHQTLVSTLSFHTRLQLRLAAVDAPRALGPSPR